MAMAFWMGSMIWVVLGNAFRFCALFLITFIFQPISPDSWQAIGVLTSLRWGSPVANF